MSSAKTNDEVNIQVNYASNNIFFEISRCVDGANEKANEKEDLPNW